MEAGRKHLLRSLAYFLLVTVATLIFVTPFFFVIYTSLRDTKDIILNGFVAPIKEFHLENYKNAFFDGNLMQASLNSLAITIPALLLMMFLSSAAAFAFARLRFRGNKIFFLFVLLSMYIPTAVKLIPIYRLYSDLGLTNSIAGLVVLQTAMCIPFCVFVLRNFFLTIPKELQEAAIIDGCSYASIYYKIYMPLSKPSLAVLVILQFTTVWNSFLWELLLMTGNTPVMVGVMTLQSQFGIEWAVQCAGAIIASVPTLLVFLIFQKHFIQGLTAGAVKG